MAVLVTDLVAAHVGNLPEEFLSLIPTKCPACDGPTVIRPSFTGLSCYQPRCIIKVASRMVAICQRIGILGVGQSVAEKIVDYYEITNPLAILTIGQQGIEPYEDAPASLINSISTTVREFQKRPMTLSEYVSLAFLPNVQTSALPLFRDYRTLEEAYQAIEAGGVQYVQRALGVDPSIVSVKAQKVYQSLLEFKRDLLEGQDLVNLDDISGLTQLRLCISESAGPPYKSKRDFMNQASEVAAEYGYHLNFTTNMTKTVDYLIYSSERTTNKLLAAWRYGISIHPGSDFIELLKSKEA